MESLKRRRHDEILARWIHVRTPGHAEAGKPDYDDSHIQSIKHAQGWNGPDELQSYGPHFPLVQALTNRTGRTRLWLINGDAWRGRGSGFGIATSSQQADVRRHCESSGVESVIIPFSALDAAGIVHDTVRVLSQDAESWQTVTHTQTETPDGVEWVPTHERIPGTGKQYRGEWDDVVPAEIRAMFGEARHGTQGGQAMPQLNLEWKAPTRVSFGREHRLWGAAPWRDYVDGNARWSAWSGGEWYVPYAYRYTGRKPNSAQKRDANGNWVSWELDSESGTWTRTTRIHTLGQSVFRAAYVGADRKRHWANFLSGVDNTPHGSGYFLVQLPRKADVSSVASAVESLKPPVVVTAESYGIPVKRQGDLFAVPTDYTLRDLRKLGADVRQSAKASETARAAIRERAETAYLAELVGAGIPTNRHVELTDSQRETRNALASEYRGMVIREQAEWDAANGKHLRRELYGTRHVGTEIAILPSGVTLARGTIRHTGGQHRYLSLGNVWHIVARNTVPLAR